MNPQSQAMQEAMMHAHPLFWAAMPLGIAVVVISLVVLVVWQMRRSAWAYHPGGSMGFLRDEALRYASIWLPFAIVMVLVRFVIYAYYPQYTASPYLIGLYLSIILFRRLARLLPHVKEISARIDGARAKAYAASHGVKS